MLLTSNSKSAPRSERLSASRVRPRRYFRSRSKSTRSSKSTAIGPGAGIGRESAAAGATFDDDVNIGRTPRHENDCRSVLYEPRRDESRGQSSYTAARLGWSARGQRRRLANDQLAGEAHHARLGHAAV